MMYGLTQPWDAGLERAIRWDSPGLAIDWPLEGADPVLSDRDRGAPGLGEAELFERSTPGSRA